MEVSYKAVPWPAYNAPQDILRWLCRKGQPREELAAVVRTQLLRWHPDRFIQAFGAKLKDADKERIMERVKTNAAFLNWVKANRVNVEKAERYPST